MQIVITTQPDPLVTLAEAKVALGESGTDRDGLIGGMIAAAQAELDGPKGWVGISVAEQSVEVTAATFDCPTIRLPGIPITGNVDVNYLDGSGLSTPLDSGDYVLLSDGSLTLAAGASWPALSDQRNAVTVAYDVGISDPADLRIGQMKTAILLHVRMTLDGVDPDIKRRAIESLVRSMWVPVL